MIEAGYPHKFNSHTMDNRIRSQVSVSWYGRLIQLFTRWRVLPGAVEGSVGLQGCQPPVRFKFSHTSPAKTCIHILCRFQQLELDESGSIDMTIVGLLLLQDDQMKSTDTNTWQKTQGEEKGKHPLYTRRVKLHGSISCKNTCLDLSGVVDLAHVDHLPAASAGHFLGIPLAHESLVGSLDSVHLVAGAADSRSKVVDTGGTAHFVNQVLDTETKAWHLVSS